MDMLTSCCVSYGVSRVYNQQCGYTLLDTQAMHDKMVSKLKIIQGSGLDPTAGQTRYVPLTGGICLQDIGRILTPSQT
jgi:hypothetical protein